ncbi:Uncharacterized protein LW93_10105 [Fusarium fujikuroi]|nr:Uncharacterized protein LW93_10105 [Fusarium fujikuroi]
MDHLHKAHPDNGEDISSIISSSAQTRVGIKSCPLCEVSGEADSPELIDHVLEHVHDFSLRSLPWPKSSEVDIGGEVGSFNWESGESAAITQWLEICEHDMEDIDPILKLSTCDYGRLAIITAQMESVRHDKLGLDMGFADEHGDDSAEAETDVSQLTQDTLESTDQARDVVLCHQCSARWYRDVDGMQCPKCQNEFVEIVDPESGSEGSDLLGTVMRPGFTTIASHDRYGEESGHLSDTTASKPSTQESTSGFRRFTDRLFSGKKADNFQPRPGQDTPEDWLQFLGLKRRAVSNLEAWKILSNVYDRQLDSPTKTLTMFANFIRDVQDEDFVSIRPPVSDLYSFLQVMVGFYLNPLKPLPLKDLSKPISNYFINSSHETASNISTGPRSTYDVIRQVLDYGYRSIDIDVWNGDNTTDDRDIQVNERHESNSTRTLEAINRLIERIRATNARPVDPNTAVSESNRLSPPAEPIVTDGYSPGTPCGFREACQLIRSTAFISNNLPVIINIMVHANPGQQDMMVKIMREEWGEMLVDEPLEGCDPRFRLPKLEDLQNRILVRISTITSHVKYEDASQHDEDYDDPRRISIIQPLAKLGVYLRQERFESFNTPLAKSPNHIFSLREDKVQGLIFASPTELFQHNQHYFLRVYPSASRRASSNLDPLRFWRHGVQMASIDTQRVDEGMMLNEGMFADELGWVLKPDGFQSSGKNSSTDLGAAPRKELELSIFIFQGQKLTTSTGREIKDLSSFLRASLYIDDEENAWEPGDGLPISREEGSGALGYEINFRVTRANGSIIPKLSILRYLSSLYHRSS